MRGFKLLQPFSAVHKELLELVRNQHMEIESAVVTVEGRIGEKLDLW